MNSYDVVALGELLIDFAQNGVSSQGNALFEACPGGAPGNVLAMLTKIGRKTAFIGKVGDDCFGKGLVSTLNGLGIDTSYILFDPNVHTTLALIHTLADGDRDFSFYRNPGADIMLKKEELKEESLINTKVFHFGSLSMTHEEVRETTRTAVTKAKEAGAIISFDPNLRVPLWNSLTDAKKQIGWGMSKCDILKISDNEIQWFCDEENYTKGVHLLQEQYNIPLILVSMGKDGSRAYFKDTMVERKAFAPQKVIDTTGAGDTFCACVIDYVLRNGLELTEEMACEMLDFANAAASVVTTKRGALLSMPNKSEIDSILH